MTRFYVMLFTLVALNGCAQCQNENENKNDNEKEKKVLTTTSAKDIQVGGPCEGCEAALEYGNRQLSWIDTLEDFNTKGPTLRPFDELRVNRAQGPKIEVSGIIYQNDGKTPAKDVILYLYHTDQTGNYTANHNETGWGRRHGSLRTWLKTNEKGEYKFYTLRPASYPGSKNPAHIHVTIKEPGKTPYWIDEFVFDDDPFLTKEERNHIRGRGGFNGVLKDGTLSEGVMRYTRDITLGLNVY
ncbi:MAG TPA: hypothetical protein VI603_08755 [Saprospiraceae bacterium]|nr:hypothetical protein [Saprospiraceae bacterium]